MSAFAECDSSQDYGEAILQIFGHVGSVSVSFKADVSLLLAPVGAEKRSLFISLHTHINVAIQLAIRKGVPAGALAGAGSYWKHRLGVIVGLGFA